MFAISTNIYFSCLVFLFRNICIWDTLLPQKKALVHSKQCYTYCKKIAQDRMENYKIDITEFKTKEISKILKFFW